MISLNKSEFQLRVILNDKNLTQTENNERKQVKQN